MNTLMLLRRASILALAVFLLGIVDAGAQSRVGSTGATFLTLGTGARGSALGHAYTSLAEGGDALFWNPGGIALASDGRQRGSLFLTHHSWFLDINYNAGGVVIPVTRSGAMGFSVSMVDYGRTDVTTEELPDGTGETFGARDLAVGVTYGQPLTESFYIGGTVKLVRQDIWDMSANTAAFDLGFILLTRYLNGMRLSASIQNFGGKLQMSGVNARVFIDPDETRSGNNPAVPGAYQMAQWDLPLSFRLGLAVPAIRLGGFEMMTLADLQQTNDNNLNSDLGLQARYRIGAVALDARAGYRDLMWSGTSETDSNLSFGAGLEMDLAATRFAFDFAYIPFSNLGDTRLFDLRLYF